MFLQKEILFERLILLLHLAQRRGEEISVCSFKMNLLYLASLLETVDINMRVMMCGIVPPYGTPRVSKNAPSRAILVLVIWAS